MKLMIVVAALVLAAACSESMPLTAPEMGLAPRFEIGVVHGGCQEPFTLGPPYDTDGIAADRNGDGLACYLQHTRTDGDWVIVFGTTWTDNNVPLSQVGGCPNGFDLHFFPKIGEDSDRDINGDHMVCTKLSGNGSTIVIDNNHRT